jgi:hypothetical protein
LVTLIVPGTKRRLTLERTCSPLFLALAHDWDAWINPIDSGPADDWGYAYRKARLSDHWSNHASGTCIDVNSNWQTGEGAQRPKNRVFWYTDHMVHTMDVMRNLYGPVADWGGDWHGSNWDPMHWEIRPRVTPLQVRTRIKQLGITHGGVRTRNGAGEKIEPRD